jgi:hypothetical protein
LFYYQALSKNDIRVKFLDKEDIENLGWNIWKELDEQTNKANKRARVYFKEAEYRNQKKAKITLIHNPLNNWILISYTNYPEDQTVFAGIIPNKSEFIKLLQQLNIE